MNSVEFLPERIKQHRRRRGRLIRRGTLMVMCLGGLALLSVYRQGQISQVRAEAAGLDAQTVALKQEIAKIGPLEQQMGDLLIKKRIDEELGSRTDCTAVLAELCRLLPQNMAMVSLDMKTVEMKLEARGGPAAINTSLAPVAAGTAPPAEAGPVKRVRLVITGLAPSDVDVANFIGQLSACPLLEDLNMGYAKNVVFRGQPAREFQATCYLAR